ncbi:MAG: hypothetical protein KBS83_06745, partial [Lachnospiraceae bacterium]|nr:hypothetical protein [Candidatus Equihabitans merdae]
MSELIISYTNIAQESISIIFLMILIITCLLQKETLATTNTLAIIAILCVGLLAVQILQWVDYINILSVDTYLPTSGRELYVRYLFLLDFGLSYLITFALFRYMQILVEFLSVSQKESITLSTKPNKVLIILGVLVGAFMLSDIWLHNVYLFDEGGIAHPTYGSLIILASLFVCPAVSIFTIIRYRKILGKYDGWLLAIYNLAMLILLPVSFVNNLSISYVAIPILIYILYFGIDIRRGQEYIQQEAVIAQREAQLEEMNLQMMVSQ